MNTLRTREEASDFLTYHSPNEDQKINHENVNNNIRVCMDNIWDSIPDGPRQNGRNKKIE